MTTEELPPVPPFQPRRRGLSRGAKIGILAVLGVLVAGVIGAIGFVVVTNNKIDRIPAEELAALSNTDNGTRTILVVGSDSRENVGDLEGSFGSFGGARTDVIMLARVDSEDGLHLLSLPRDLYVDIPGHERNRINAAFVAGGPDLLIATIANTTGIDVNHYIEVDFAGFAAIVDSVGGIVIDFDHPARDKKSGLRVLDKGKVRLDGAQALAYARSRNYEEKIGNEWKLAGGSDIQRTGRQQEVLLALFDEVTSRSGVFDLPGFASTIADQLTVDEGLSLGALIDLGQTVAGLSRADIHTRTLPVEGARIDNREVVVEREPMAALVIEAFVAGQPYPQLTQ